MIKDKKKNKNNKQKQLSEFKSEQVLEVTRSMILEQHSFTFIAISGTLLMFIISQTWLINTVIFKFLAGKIFVMCFCIPGLICLDTVIRMILDFCFKKYNVRHGRVLYKFASRNIRSSSYKVTLILGNNTEKEYFVSEKLYKKFKNAEFYYIAEGFFTKSMINAVYTKNKFEIKYDLINEPKFNFWKMVIFLEIAIPAIIFITYMILCLFY